MKVFYKFIIFKVTSMLYLSISLSIFQYLIEEVSNEVDFLRTDKQSFLQVDNIFFDGFGQACPKYPDKFAIFCDISRNNSGTKLIFAWKHQIFP